MCVIHTCFVYLWRICTKVFLSLLGRHNTLHVNTNNTRTPQLREYRLYEARAARVLSEGGPAQKNVSKTCFPGRLCTSVDVPERRCVWPSTTSLFVLSLALLRRSTHIVTPHCLQGREHVYREGRRNEYNSARHPFLSLSLLWLLQDGSQRPLRTISWGGVTEELLFGVPRESRPPQRCQKYSPTYGFLRLLCSVAPVRPEMKIIIY